jgi:Protein of unknown function (DUF1153)
MIEKYGMMSMTHTSIDHAVGDRPSAQLDGRMLVASNLDEALPPAVVDQVIGPDGRFLTVANLPPPNTKRWVIRRKAEVLAAVCGGLLSLDEACSRYGLHSEEILSWQYRINRFGLAGLRTTRTQFYLRPTATLGSSSSRAAGVRGRLREPLGAAVVLRLHVAAAGAGMAKYKSLARTVFDRSNALAL